MLQTYFGQCRHRILFLDFNGTNALIYIIDSNDVDRMGEARMELETLLADEELQDAMLLVIANKQDLPHALSVSEITDKLNLHSVRSRPWYIQVNVFTFCVKDVCSD